MIGTIITQYWREYYVSADQQLRVTLDYQQRAYDQQGYLQPNLRLAQMMPDLLVVEIKAAPELAERLEQLTGSLPLQRLRHSKLCKRGQILVTLAMRKGRWSYWLIFCLGGLLAFLLAAWWGPYPIDEAFTFYQHASRPSWSDYWASGQPALLFVLSWVPAGSRPGVAIGLGALGWWLAAGQLGRLLTVESRPQESVWLGSAAAVLFVLQASQFSASGTALSLTILTALILGDRVRHGPGWQAVLAASLFLFTWFDWSSSVLLLLLALWLWYGSRRQPKTAIALLILAVLVAAFQFIGPGFSIAQTETITWLNQTWRQYLHESDLHWLWLPLLIAGLAACRQTPWLLIWLPVVAVCHVPLTTVGGACLECRLRGPGIAGCGGHRRVAAPAEGLPDKWQRQRTNPGHLPRGAEHSQPDFPGQSLAFAAIVLVRGRRSGRPLLAGADRSSNHAGGAGAPGLSTQHPGQAVAERQQLDRFAIGLASAPAELLALPADVWGQELSRTIWVGAAIPAGPRHQQQPRRALVLPKNSPTHRTGPAHTHRRDDHLRPAPGNGPPYPRCHHTRRFGRYTA